MTRRNVTARVMDPPVDTRAQESLSVLDDERQRFRIYSLCPCPVCDGEGKVLDVVTAKRDRCAECRGEGKKLVFITQHDEVLGAGLALIQLAIDGEFLDDCPPGLLDSEAESEKWLINPWKQSARTVSAAARELALARKTGGS